MPPIKVAQASWLPPGETREVEIGGRIVALCNDAGTITALDGVCPHHGGPLGHGTICQGRLACPWHLWEFDCRTGAFDRDPGLRVATYRVEVRGDDILVDLERPGA